MIYFSTCAGNNHCKITYDARTDQATIYDLSTNGTFVRIFIFLSPPAINVNFQVSSTRIGKGKSRILREGNEITFGPSTSIESQDVRWLYRQIRKPNANSESGVWEKYEMGSELGRGTFASVFRCMDRNTGKWYAVKVIQRSKFQNSPINETNFNREIKLLMKMHHVGFLERSSWMILSSGPSQTSSIL